jgi:hypothetical protein
VRPVILQATDGGITVSAEQADALRDLGHLSGGRRTDLTRAAVLQFLVDRPELGICDFCSQPGVAWDFPAVDHNLPPAGQDRSVGSWRACESCATLIRAARRDDLAREGARRMGSRVVIVRAIHDTFWAHRQGAGRRID